MNTFASLDFGFPELGILIVTAVVLAFEIWMFIDAARNSALSVGMRILWIFVILFFNLPASILYYFLVYQKHDRF